MDKFNQAIRTTQVAGGGIYVEAQLSIDGSTHTYGQHYSSDENILTYAKDIPEAVERFKRFYYPLYLTDIEATL